MSYELQRVCLLLLSLAPFCVAACSLPFFSIRVSFAAAVSLAGVSVRCSLAPVSLSLAPFSLQTEARLHRSQSLSLAASLLLASLLLACPWLASLCILSMKSSLGEYCVDVSLQATRLSLVPASLLMAWRIPCSSHPSSLIALHSLYQAQPL